MYGHRWTSSYGPEDDGTWRKGLHGITPAQVGTGLVHCLERGTNDSGEDWPPTLSEFRAMCLPEKMPAYHREYVALPKPATNPEQIDKQISKMRNLLK